MATNIIEVLLKFRKEGAEVFDQVSSSVSELKKNLSSGGNVDAFLGGLADELKKAGAEVSKVEEAMAQLKAATQNPLSANYASGFLEAMKSTDKAALEAKLSIASVKAELAKGGGNAAFLTGMMDALKMTSTEADKARQNIEKLSGVNLTSLRTSLDGVGDSLKKVNGGAGLNQLSNVFKQVEGSATSLVGVVKGLAAAFAGLAVVGYLKSAADAAARTEVLGTVLYQVGKNAGYTKEEMDRADKSVQKMGITAAASREALVQLMNAGLNINLAGPLARAAQDLAVIAGWNSSETFQRMLTNIAQLDTMGLRHMGITVDRVKAETKYAQALGKSVDALTAKEQKEAFANEVLAEAAKRQGIYEASMTNVAKQVQSLARYKENLAVTIGERLLPAYLQLVEQFTFFLGEAEKTAKGIDKNKTAAQEFGDVVGTLAKGLRDLISVLVEHKEIVLGLAAAWAGIKLAGMVAGFFAVQGAATALSAAIGGIVTALGALVGSAALGAFGAMVSQVGLLQAAGVALMGVLEAIASFFLTKLVLAFPVLEGLAIRFMMLVGPIGLATAALLALWKIWEAGKAYWDMTEARKELEQFQKKLSDDLKKLPDDFKAAFDKYKSNAADMVNTTGKSKEQIKAQMEEMAKAIEYAGKRYALAMSKGKDATEEDKKAIQEWNDIVQGQMIPAIGKMAEAMRLAREAERDPEAERFAKKAADINELTMSYKDVTAAVKDYQKAIQLALDTTYKLANEGLAKNYKEEQAVLAATEQYQGQNRQKMLQNDQEYYRQSVALVREEFENRRNIMQTSYQTEATLLQQIIDRKNRDNQDAKAETAELLQQKQRYTEQSLQLAEQEYGRLQSLRDQAFQRYTDQLKQIAQLQRQISQENLDHEVKIHDLTMRLREDEFRSREDTLKARERSLEERERIAQQTGNKADQENIRREREQIAWERKQIAIDRESMEKAIEADAKAQFSKYIAMAREELAKGAQANVELAAEYEKIASKYGSASKSIADQLNNENQLHSVKIERLTLQKTVAEESAAVQKRAMETLTEAVNQSKYAIEDLIDKLAQLGYENQIFTLKSKFDQLSGEIEDTAAKIAKLRDGNMFGTKNAEIEELERKLGRLKGQQNDTKASMDGLAGSLDKLKADRQLRIDTRDAEKARAKVEEESRRIDGALRDKKITIEADTNQASNKVGEFRREVDQAFGGGASSRTLKVNVLTDEAKRELTTLQSQADTFKRNIEENKRLGMDTTIARANLAIVEDKMRQIKGEARDPIQLRAITDEAVSKMQGLGFTAKEAREALGKPWEIKVTDNATGEIRRISGEIQSLENQSGQITITPNTSQVDGAIQRVRSDLQTLGQTPVEVDVTADDAPAKAEIQSIDDSVPPVDVSVTADTAQAMQSISSLSTTAPSVTATVTADTSQAQASISQVQSQRIDVQGQIRADNSQAMAAIYSIPRYIETIHYIRTVRSPNTGGLLTHELGLSHFADGGWAKFAGLVSGAGTGLSDSIPAMIANGEYILKAAAVDHYGVDFLQKLNNMLVPRIRGFADGGLVGATAVAGRMPAMTSAPPANDAGAKDVVDVNFNVGGKSYKAQSARDTAKQLAGALRELSRAS